MSTASSIWSRKAFRFCHLQKNIIRDSEYFEKSTPLSAFQYFADMIQTHYRGIAAVHGAVKLFSGQLLGFL